MIDLEDVTSINRKRPYAFFVKGVLQMYTKFTGETNTCIINWCIFGKQHSEEHHWGTASAMSNIT